MLKKLRQFFCRNKVQIVATFKEGNKIDYVSVYCHKCGKILDVMKFYEPVLLTEALKESYYDTI